MSVNVVLPKLEQKNKKNSFEKIPNTDRNSITERFISMDMI